MNAVTNIFTTTSLYLVHQRHGHCSIGRPFHKDVPSRPHRWSPSTQFANIGPVLTSGVRAIWRHRADLSQDCRDGDREQPSAPRA